METTIIEKLGNFAMDDKFSQEELIRRIEQLELEKAESSIAAQKNLHKCEAQYQAMLESVDAHMTLVDRNLNILWANEKAKGIFGHNIVGKSCCDAFFAKKVNCGSESSCLSRNAFRTGGKVKLQTMKVTAKDGARLYFEGSAKVVAWDSDGRPSMIVKIYKDITKRRQVEMDLRANMKQMRKNLNCTIQAIARTVESRDAYTAGHQRQTTEIAGAIAFEMGLTKQEIDGIRMAGVIHDLGKISVPAEILSKPGRINESELSLIKQHPQAGYDILKGIDFKWPVADIILQHHERLNGSGYPNNLHGDQILLEARIIGVADVIEAMASHRPYRPALGIDDAFEEITTQRGVRYDPDVVDASIDLFTKRGYQIH